MNRFISNIGLVFFIAVSGVASVFAGDMDRSPLATQLADRERAFAQTMAARDVGAFASFIDPEAVFFSSEEPLRGRDAILQQWQRYFESASPPFSWQPDTVEVLASGSLAMTSGPVLDSAGTLIARFNSIWREGADKVWRVVFDKGNEVCSCGKP